MSLCFCECKADNEQLFDYLRNSQPNRFKGDNCTTIDEFKKNNYAVYRDLSYDCAMRMFRQNSRCKCCVEHKTDRRGMEDLRTVSSQSN